MRSQRGQAIIIMAFVMVVMLGFAAIAIDGGTIFVEQRHPTRSRQLRDYL